jgi:hypothetical protein
MLVVPHIELYVMDTGLALCHPEELRLTSRGINCDPAEIWPRLGSGCYLGSS